ncbi:hypothetical protein, partial [Pseudomonas sp. 2995-1]|uniref:hypothetical protein n=1 Tax=Pseudomonas sp. 2995-1 TaxID=1712679 RepID=UPI001C446644
MKSVWDSEWTSIHEYLHKEGIIDIDRGLNLFSFDRKTAVEKYIIYMQDESEDQCLDFTEKVIL